MSFHNLSRGQLEDCENPSEEPGCERMTGFTLSTKHESESESENEDEVENLEQIGKQLSDFQTIFHGVQEGNTRFVKSLVRVHRLEKIASLLRYKPNKTAKIAPEDLEGQRPPSTIFYNK